MCYKSHYVFLEFPDEFLSKRVLHKVLYWKAPPQGPTPYPLLCHFVRKGNPFPYLFFLNVVSLSRIAVTGPHFNGVAVTLM